MKKNGWVKKTAFSTALLLCLMVNLPAALAANTNDTTLTNESALSETEIAIAAFKAEVIRLVNIEREQAGVAPVEEMEILDIMADVRAEESSEVFKHTRPDGTRCFSIFSEYELTYWAAGENLAYGFRTPEKVVDAWMNSESHRRNILDPDFEFIGIGYCTSERNRIYCSQLFYSPK